MWYSYNLVRLSTSWELSEKLENVTSRANLGDLQEMSGYLKTSDFSKSGENLPKSWNCWLGANSCSFQETGGLGTKPRDPGFGRSGTETRGFRRGGLGGPETGLEGVLGAPEQVGTGT